MTVEAGLQEQDSSTLEAEITKKIGDSMTNLSDVLHLSPLLVLHVRKLLERVEDLTQRITSLEKRQTSAIECGLEGGKPGITPEQLAGTPSEQASSPDPTTTP